MAPIDPRFLDKDELDIAFENILRKKKHELKERYGFDIDAGRVEKIERMRTERSLMKTLGILIGVCMTALIILMFVLVLSDTLGEREKIVNEYKTEQTVKQKDIKPKEGNPL